MLDLDNEGSYTVMSRAVAGEVVQSLAAEVPVVVNAVAVATADIIVPAADDTLEVSIDGGVSWISTPFADGHLLVRNHQLNSRRPHGVLFGCR